MKRILSVLLTLVFLCAVAYAEDRPAETLYGFVLSVEDENALLIATESLGQMAVTDENGNAQMPSGSVTQVLVRLPESLNAADYERTWVRVDYNGVMTMSLPGQINADAVTPCFAAYGQIEEIADGVITLAIHFGEEILSLNTDETTALPQDLKPGDTVRVFHNGQMTRSIPAQVFALAVERAAQIAVVSLDGNPSTGYQWTVSIEDARVASLVSVEYVLNDYEGDIIPPGTGGTYFFTFSAAGVGETPVTFTYARPWSSEETVTEQYKLTVDEDLSITCEYL